MAARDPWAERYNRRTRAIERQAAAERMKVDALDRIAAALELQALATAASTRPATEGGRVWTNEFGTKIQNVVASAAKKIGGFQ